MHAAHEGEFRQVRGFHRADYYPMFQRFRAAGGDSRFRTHRNFSSAGERRRRTSIRTKTKCGTKQQK